jgi:hypothetical protein
MPQEAVVEVLVQQDKQVDHQEVMVVQVQQVQFSVHHQ